MGASKLLVDRPPRSASASAAPILGLVQGCVQQPVSGSPMPMLAVGDTAGSVKTGV